jgi:hypothetical protein
MSESSRSLFPVAMQTDNRRSIESNAWLKASRNPAKGKRIRLNIQRILNSSHASYRANVESTRNDISYRYRIVYRAPARPATSFIKLNKSGLPPSSSTAFRGRKFPAQLLRHIAMFVLPFPATRSFVKSLQRRRWRRDITLLHACLRISSHRALGADGNGSGRNVSRPLRARTSRKNV